LRHQRIAEFAVGDFNLDLAVWGGDISPEARAVQHYAEIMILQKFPRKKLTLTGCGLFY